MTKTMEALLNKSAKLRENHMTLIKRTMLTKGDGVENNQTWKLRSMLWCSIVVTIRLSPEPLSILASLKTILDEMDAHYDSIACVLARFRSQSNPSDQLLDGMMVWVDNIWVFQWIFLQCRSWISYSLVDLTSSFGFQINNPLRLLQYKMSLSTSRKPKCCFLPSHFLFQKSSYDLLCLF